MIHKAIIVTFFAATLISANEREQTKEKSNIIFILTDDQRWDALGFAGNDIIYTPEMDKLASEGIYFKNAFVTTPICAASRATIMTGLYERTHDYTFGTPPLKTEYIQESYPQILKNNGYSTGFVGKLGINFSKKAELDIFDFIERPGEQFWATTYYRLTKDHTGHRHLTTEIGDLSRNFIEKFHKKGPFCLSISFHAPHAEDSDPRQYIYPVELDTLYQDIQIPGPLNSSDQFFQSQPEYVRNGLNRVRWYWRFDTPEKYQEMVKGYYRMISGIDREIGKLRAFLDDLGIADNTVIILMGDNGYFLGERQIAGKWLMYENSLRVPLIIYDPSRNKLPEVSDYLALNLDIAPTILDFAGMEIPPNMQGVSLKYEGMDAKRKLIRREDFLCEHLFNHPNIPKSEGIRTKNMKYFRYIDHPEDEELYNLESDPMEIINLAEEKKYMKEVEKLRCRLDELIKEYDK